MNWMLNESDMERFVQHDLVYRGYTEPGDVLLNPPFLWHFVQTARGFNFAVTYKQLRHGMLGDLMKMDPVRARTFWDQIPGGMEHDSGDGTLEALHLVATALFFGLPPGHPLNRPTARPMTRAEFLRALLVSDHPFLKRYQLRVRKAFVWAGGAAAFASVFFVLGRCSARRGATPTPLASGARDKAKES
mmetsp:Transcript_97275/g.280006  ORF Transcript_97275/g.280006 Transcript_97275/m.280006 type:complete len:189 (+) Transcript_97275:66-632(+)